MNKGSILNVKSIYATFKLKNLAITNLIIDNKRKYEMFLVRGKI